MQLDSRTVLALAVVGLLGGAALYVAPVPDGRRLHTALLALGVLGLLVVLAEAGWRSLLAG